jgi:putative nucleotidyltransferase with HDIG domain
MTARILYVDDEFFVLNAFKRMARMAGYEVHTTDSPDEALAWLEHNQVEVICSDFRMPAMDGLQFLTAAAEKAPGALRILITAHQDFDVAVDAFEVGVYRLIPKPWKREVLLGTLSEAAASVLLRRENERLSALVAERNRELTALNASLDEKVRQRTDQVIGSLITCLDYRDEETMAHSKRVSLFSREIALALGIDGPELGDIEWGAMLHDVGKIGVPDAILLKPGKLTDDEWKIMRRHASIGFHMVSQVDFLQRAARVVGDHHERFDGSGYPHRKSGDDIYIGARIFSVADTFDAITSDRPYRKKQSDEAAKSEIRRVAGTQLDPQCVEAFLGISDERWAEIREQARLWAAARAAPPEAEPIKAADLETALRAIAS